MHCRVTKLMAASRSPHPTPHPPALHPELRDINMLMATKMPVLVVLASERLGLDLREVGCRLSPVKQRAESHKSCDFRPGYYT